MLQSLGAAFAARLAGDFRDAVDASAERELEALISSALHRAFDPGLAADAELMFKQRLLLVADGVAPRLASYASRGDLRAWLRAAAVRTAIDLMRARKELPTDSAALDDAQIASDPLLAGAQGALPQDRRTDQRVARIPSLSHRVSLPHRQQARRTPSAQHRLDNA